MQAHALLKPCFCNAIMLLFFFGDMFCPSLCSQSFQYQHSVVSSDTKRWILFAYNEWFLGFHNCKICLFVCFLKNVVVKMLSKQLRRPRFNLWPDSLKVFSNILWAAPSFYPFLSGKMKIKVLRCVWRHVLGLYLLIIGSAQVIQWKHCGNSNSLQHYVFSVWGLNLENCS